MLPLSSPEPVVEAAALQAALDSMDSSPFVAVDTEFMREKTYYPKLCLVQLATSERCVLVDPLALEDVQPLLDFLRARKRLKALHAARQDIEVLLAADRDGACDQPVPAPIFDTQLAGAFLGAPAQVGYADLVATWLNHTLAKGHARTDWLRRPLSDEQLRYAADDVTYLVPLYQRLQAALRERDRLGWFEEECGRMENPGIYRTEPAQAWQRFKGLDRLRPPQRAALKALTTWRELVAMKHDKPRGWILADETVRALSERLPQSVDSLAGVAMLPPATLRKHGEELIALITAAAQSGDDDLVTWQRPEPQQLSKVSRLMEFVRAEAQRLQISPELLATRRDIEQLVFRGKTERFQQGWRAEAIGAGLLDRYAA